MTKKKIAAIAASGLIIVGAATNHDKPKAATQAARATPTATATPRAQTPTPTPVPLSAKIRYKRHKFYCDDGDAYVGDGSVMTTDKKSAAPGDRRFCTTNMQARYDDDQFSCVEETDTSLTRKERRFCARKIHGWHWHRAPKPVKPSDDCSDKASALALAALLSGHPITAAEAAKLAVDTAGTGEKCP